MKRFGLLFLLILAISVPAFAQYPDGATGDISAYADEAGASCNIVATGGGQVQLFLVHKFSDGGSATGSRFKITFPATGISVFGFQTTFVPIGNITTDMSLGYGVCINATTSLGMVTAFSTVVAPTCSYISVVAADNFSAPISTDCSFGEYKVEVGQGIVNDNGSCPCNIATQPSTWGKVKSLYR